MNLDPRQTWLLAASALLFGAARIAHGETAASASFDAGVDASAALAEAREKARTAHFDEGIRPAFRRWERDCAGFSFSPEDPATSEEVTLESRFYEERCYGDPRYGRDCHEEWVYTERRHVRVRVSGRGPMLPWERDRFEVCLDGQWLDARVIDASHNYHIDAPGYGGGTVEARALEKRPALPDPAGVIADSFRFEAASGGFEARFRDRWASYYAGDATGLELKLKRYRKNWFDSTLWTKELSFPAAEDYALRLADYASEIKGLENGKEYYLQWRFRRLGKVSKDAWQGAWETPRAAYGRPAPAAMTLASAASFNYCWYRTVEKDQCVYHCRDGAELRLPVREPDPWDRDGAVIPCPQFVIPHD